MKSSYKMLSSLVVLLLLTTLGPVSSVGRADELTSTIANVQQKVVKLYGAGGLRNLPSYGSGVLISADGDILTIWNHIVDIEAVQVVLWDGRKLSAKLIQADYHLNLALLKVDASELPYFDLSQTATLQPGDGLLAFSNMFNVAVGDEPISVVHGVVSAEAPLSARRGVTEIQWPEPVLMIDALTNNSGAAGGAVTNYQGEFVGLLGQELRDRRWGTWINYALPLAQQKDRLLALQRGEVLKQEEMAVNRFPPSEQLVVRLGILMVPNVVSQTPPYLDHLIPQSPAIGSGLNVGDLIVFVNETPVASVNDVLKVLREVEQGELVRLTVRRDRELITVDLRGQ